MKGITCPHCKMKIEIGVDTPKIEKPLGYLKVVNSIDWEIHQNVVENPEYRDYIYSGSDAVSRRLILEKVC